MKCFIVLFAVLTATTARHVRVNEDGTISVHGDHGKQVIISRPQGPDGERIIEIAGHGSTPEHHIEINDNDHLQHQDEEHHQQQHGHHLEDAEHNRLVRGAGQDEVLDSIFRQFQGRLDEDSYQRLLKQVEHAVERQQIHRSVYEALQHVSHDHEGLERLVPGYLIRRPQFYYDSYAGKYHNHYGQEQMSYHRELGVDAHGRRMVAIDDNGRRAVLQQTQHGVEVYEPEAHQRYFLEHEGHRYHHGQEQDYLHRAEEEEHRRDYYGLNQHQWHGHGEGHQGYGRLDDIYRNVLNHGRYETYADLLRRQHEHHQIVY